MTTKRNRSAIIFAAKTSPGNIVQVVLGRSSAVNKISFTKKSFDSIERYPSDSRVIRWLKPLGAGCIAAAGKPFCCPTMSRGGLCILWPMQPQQRPAARRPPGLGRHHSLVKRASLPHGTCSRHWCGGTGAGRGSVKHYKLVVQALAPDE